MRLVSTLELADEPTSRFPGAEPLGLCVHQRLIPGTSGPLLP